MDSHDSAYATAINILTRSNLSDLWVTSSALSTIDFFETGMLRDTGVIFPALNQRLVSLFDQAILDSRSRDYKTRILSGGEFLRVKDLLSHASDTSREVDYNADLADFLFRMLSSTLNAQIPFQGKDWLERFGRAFAMYESLPLQHEPYLRTRHQSGYINIPEVVRSLFGISVRDFLQIGYWIHAFYMHAYNTALTLSQNTINRIEAARTNGKGDMFWRAADVILSDIVSRSKEIDVVRRLVFFENNLVVKSISAFSIENIHAYLSTIARTTKQLSLIKIKMSRYEVGDLADQASPLERFPIVKLVNGGYVVPNLRYFNVASTEALYHFLQSQYPNNQFTEVLGTIQELYLQALFSQRLPECKVVAERPYARGKSPVHGPDFAVIDSSCQGLVVIESKAKRSTLTSRLEPSGQATQRDLIPATRALLGLARKITDLYAGLPEYMDVQNDLDNTKSRPPICVVIMGEGILQLQEALSYHIRRDATHPLNSFPFPYCIMDLKTFERTVEVSAQNEMSLYELLTDWWKTIVARTVTPEASKMVHKLPYDPNRTFVSKYRNDLLDNLTSGHYHKDE